MCFSATASFIAGVSLSSLGVVTLKKVGRKAEIPLAMIPLLFGVQQLTEGMLWLSFRFEAPLLNVSMTYAFSLFSHVLWPIFVPFSIVLVEKTAWRKKAILVFLFIGIAVGLYLLYMIVKFPVWSEVDEHIVYVSPHFYQVPVMVLYLAATTIAPLFSSDRIINLFGVLALLLAMLAYWIQATAFFSIWCFFAAILSSIIYLHFELKKQRTPHLKRNLAKVETDD